MKLLYLDCGMGAAGDMLTAALIQLLPEPQAFVEELNALGLPGVVYRLEPAVKCGITGGHMSVTVHGEEEESHDHHSHEHAQEHHHGHDHEHTQGHHHHAHSGMHDIEHIVRDHLQVPEAVKADILAVYGLIAQAESKAHGAPVEEIHFHEVGTLDAIADVTAVCLLLHRLDPRQIVASPVHVGSGHVHCAHGILPVPAPATATILEGVPIYGGEIQGELCTPTGAALLKHFVTRFGPMPTMTPQAIGYGMGKKDFPIANCVRALLGEAADQREEIVQLACNVDDCTGEDIAFAMERLFEAGARDVFTLPIGMKKSRPGTLLCVLCTQGNKEEMVRLLFRHTTTIGVRETPVFRYILDRKAGHVPTPYGEVKTKVSSGYGVTREKPEYEDLAKIAREHGLTLEEVRRQLGQQQS